MAGQSGLQQKGLFRGEPEGASGGVIGSVTLPRHCCLLGSAWLEGLECLGFFKLRCSSHTAKEQILNVQVSGICYVHNVV